MSKITEEQLKTANENQEKLIGLVNQIGVIETQKHALLHDVAEVNKKVEELKEETKDSLENDKILEEIGEYHKLKTLLSKKLNRVL